MFDFKSIMYVSTTLSKINSFINSVFNSIQEWIRIKNINVYLSTKFLKPFYSIKTCTAWSWVWKIDLEESLLKWTSSMVRKILIKTKWYSIRPRHYMY